jgi:hypothetical protein
VTAPDANARWQPLSIAQCGALFGGLRIAWWIAGGWAIDLFLGRQTRTHNDVDISILRRDVAALGGLLDRFELFIAHDGAFSAWHGGPLASEHHQFWARRRGQTTWAFEILVEECRGEVWHYRRDPRITRPLAEFGRTTTDGVPYIAPELALLYKARWLDVDRNARDFEGAAPALAPRARSWLANSLSLTHPDHPWIARLQ